MFYLMPFQQDWSRVSTALRHWLDFQQQSAKELTDFLAAMSPQKDMKQIICELKDAHASLNGLSWLNLWLSPEKYHQAVMELLEIFQVVEQRIKTSQNHATKVCMESTSGTNMLLHQQSASPDLVANLLEHQLHCTKSLKNDQTEMISAMSALQVALKAWGYRQIAQTEASPETEPEE